MSSVKSFPEGLKWIECKCGIGGKNSPIHYIPKQDPMQDALEKNKKTTYFKLTLPNTGNELKVAVWASGTPELYLFSHHDTSFPVPLPLVLWDDPGLGGLKKTRPMSTTS